MYFGKRSEANQVIAENLYKVKEELRALFLLQRCVPILPQSDVKENPRYAKIENYSDEIRLDEGAVYVKITINFTEEIPTTKTYDVIDGVDFQTENKPNEQEE